MTYQRLVRGWGIFLFLVMSGLAVGQALALAPAAPLDGARGAGLLQFRAGQHILGFTPQRAYLVGLGYALIEDFVGANQVLPVAAGGDSQANTPGASPFAGVQYRDLWQGITLNYRPTPTGLTESHYAIAPQAEVAAIRLRYNTKVRVQADGTLRFAHPNQKGYFSQSAPVAWQETAGRREWIAVAFRQYDDHTIGFAVGDYDKQLPLVIDPTYEWHSFYGSLDGDYCYGITVDAGGNLYVTGESDTTWDGDGGATPLHAHSGGRDILVLKLDPNGVYQWHTFYGAVTDDFGWSIAVDTSGSVYVTGGSTATWNGDSGTPPLHAHSGERDILVLKFNPNGIYQWHSFYGAVTNDVGWSIAVGTSGNVYITGQSSTTWNGPGGEAPLHAYSAGSSFEIFILKLDYDGFYQWHSFYGSEFGDSGEGIAVDGSGNVYVTGGSVATWNGPGGDAPLHAHSGSSDLFVLKLDPAGDYQWHSFYGSMNSENGIGISMDVSGNVYVMGVSWATWNGASGEEPLHAYSGSSDLFVLKLDPAGAYQWHSFYGSTNIDYGQGLAVDADGNLYVTGYSNTTWSGDNEETPLHAHNGDGKSDIFFLKLDTAGAYQWHSFYGSTNSDYGQGIAVDTARNLLVTQCH